MNIFGCNIEIRSSHNINYIEFSGGNQFFLGEKFSLNCPYGNKGTVIEIDNEGDNKIVAKVSSEEINSKDKQVKYLERISILLSAILGFREVNPNYGTPFISLDLHKFFSREEGLSSAKGLNMTDSLAITSTTRVKFSDYDFSSIQETEFLYHYYNGLKAEGEKSKYFHFFLVLEILEGCNLYKRNFPDGTLFSEEDKAEIRKFSVKFNELQKNSLLSCLNRTEKSRNEKLLWLINQIGIIELMRGTGKKIELSTIKKITEARNKLFHSGQSFNSNLLYSVLFPLVSLMVEKVLKNPDCLS